MINSVAVISDIHGNVLALEAVVADISRRGVDVVINLGDHVSGPLWPKKTVRFLMQQEWIQISGNHDRQLVQQDPDSLGPSDRYAFESLDAKEKDWLRALHPTGRLNDETLLFHGTPSDDSSYLLETIEHGRTRLASPNEVLHRLGNARSPVMLCGHTHVQRLVEPGIGTMIVNPGSVGLPAYRDDSPVPHVVESGSPHARYALLENQDARWTVEFIAVSYDSQKAAAQALRNDRPDWAIALRTGSMSQQ